jgi:hypothetical protein
VSYGVIGSKNAQLLVEARDGVDARRADPALARFHETYGEVWVAGRVTLTGLKLTFATPSGPGLHRTEVALREIAGVEIGPGRISREIGLRTPGYDLRLRTTGALPLAQAIARGAEDARSQDR